MNDLPRLELTEDPNKKNDYIIYRYSVKKQINSKTDTSKHGTKKMNIQTKWKKRNRTQRNTRKGIFNIFS